MTVHGCGEIGALSNEELGFRSVLEMHFFSVFKPETSGKPWRSVNSAAFPSEMQWLIHAEER